MHTCSGGGGTVAGCAEGRDNNFNLVRFLAATSVILFHCYALRGHPEAEPFYRWSGGVLGMGNLGVYVFFVVSGFLVAKSFDQQPSIIAFIAARVLRIYPGLIAAALVTVAIAMTCTTVPWRSFLTDAQTFDYLLVTISGWDVRDPLPGAFAGKPYPWAVNGSLWTLPIELKFYIGCLVAGVLGVLRRPWRFNIAFVAAALLFTFRPNWFPVHPEMGVVRQFALAFALGAFAWVNRDRVPSPWLALVALVVLFANPLGFGRGVYFDVLVAYLLLVFALHPAVRFRAFNRLGDYSYGLYVYAFPIQQMLIYRWPQGSSAALFWAAFPLTLALAVLSWHLVEVRMLRLKRVFSGRAARSDAPIAVA